jgi:hypothetical protein
MFPQSERFADLFQPRVAGATRFAAFCLATLTSCGASRREKSQRGPENYELAQGFPEAGRMFFASMRARF